VNQRSKRTRDIGQNRLYKFCYLLSFDLWTSYLARIFSSKRMCDTIQARSNSDFDVKYATI